MAPSPLSQLGFLMPVFWEGKYSSLPGEVIWKQILTLDALAFSPFRIYQKLLGIMERNFWETKRRKVWRIAPHISGSWWKNRDQGASEGKDLSIFWLKGLFLRSRFLWSKEAFRKKGCQFFDFVDMVELVVAGSVRPFLCFFFFFSFFPIVYYASHAIEFIPLQHSI